jgi:hypothetical protein
VQLSSHASQPELLPRVPVPRAAPRLGPYPGPYAFPYAGPNRPYPELLRSRPARRVRPEPIPRLALAAGTFAIAGALPLALLVGSAVALGGLSGDRGVEWWLYPLLLAPVLQLGGAVALLTGRSWRLLALACLPATAFFGYLLVQLAVDGPGRGLGWYSFALGAPLIGLVLVLLPSPRSWVDGRRRAAIRAGD